MEGMQWAASMPPLLSTTLAYRPSPEKPETVKGEKNRVISPLETSRGALLLIWCWCVHPMRAGAAGF